MLPEWLLLSRFPIPSFLYLNITSVKHFNRLWFRELNLEGFWVFRLVLALLLARIFCHVRSHGREEHQGALRSFSVCSLSILFFSFSLCWAPWKSNWANYCKMWCDNIASIMPLGVHTYMLRVVVEKGKSHCSSTVWGAFQRCEAVVV